MSDDMVWVAAAALVIRQVIVTWGRIAEKKLEVGARTETTSRPMRAGSHPRPMLWMSLAGILVDAVMVFGCGWVLWSMQSNLSAPTVADVALICLLTGAAVISALRKWD